MLLRRILLLARYQVESLHVPLDPHTGIIAQIGVLISALQTLGLAGALF